MSEAYGMVRGVKFNAVQKPHWEGAETRKCPKCGKKKRQSSFTSDSRWCIECTQAAREERRKRHRGTAVPAVPRKAATPQVVAPKPSADRPASKGLVNELAQFSATDAEVYAWLRKHCDAADRVRVRGMFEVAEATCRTLASVRSSLKSLERANRIVQYSRGDELIVFVTPCDVPLRVKGGNQ